MCGRAARWLRRVKARVTLWLCLALILAFSGAVTWYAWTHASTLLDAPSGSGSEPEPAAELRTTMVTEGVKLAMQLGVIGVIGGLAKLILDAFQGARQRREGTVAALQGFVGRLHAARAQAERARVVLGGRETLEDYRAQVGELAMAKSQLENLAANVTANKHVPSARQVVEALAVPQFFLGEVIEEWQREDGHMVEAQAGGRSDAIVEHLHSLRLLQDVRQGGDSYRRRFIAPLDAASGLLNEDIAEGT
jgi:hypothetical protein